MKRYGTLAFRPDEGGEAVTTGWVAPEDWPEQFKDPTKLLDSYKESQAAMNRAMQERDAERQQFTAAIEQMQIRPAPSTNGNGAVDPLEAQFTAAIESGDAAAMFRIQTEAAASAAETRIGKMLDDKLGQIQPVLDHTQAAQREASIRTAEDLARRQLGTNAETGRFVYDELLPTISTLVQEHPHYLPAQSSVEGYAGAIMDVAKLAQHDTLTTKLASLEAERAEKLAAQTISGNGRGSIYTQDEQKAEFERIKNTPTGSFNEVLSRK